MGTPPLVADGSDQPPDVYANPVPQALILTAIVIGFGVLAFALVLAYRVVRTGGSDDPDAMRVTEALPPPAEAD